MLRMAWPEEAEPIFVSFRRRQLGRNDEEKTCECVLSARVSRASRGLKRSDELRQNARAIEQKCLNQKSVTFVVFRHDRRVSVLFRLKAEATTARPRLRFNSLVLIPSP